MSKSTLIIFRDGKAERDTQYQNSCGTALMIWSALLKRYHDLIHPEDRDVRKPIRDPFLEWELLWKKSADLPLLWWEKAVLDWTFDNALVKGDDINRFIEALQRFEDTHSESNKVCHLAAIAARLRSLPDIEAAGLWGTSISPNPWEDYHFDEVDRGHWWVEVRT